MFLEIIVGAQNALVQSQLLVLPMRVGAYTSLLLYHTAGKRLICAVNLKKILWMEWRRRRFVAHNFERLMRRKVCFDG